MAETGGEKMGGTGYETIWYWNLMEQSLEDARTLTEIMIKEIDKYEASGNNVSGAASASLSSSSSSSTSNRSSSSGSGGRNVRASLSMGAPPTSANAKARKRERIQADNTISSNEISATEVEVVAKSPETELAIKCILKAHFLFRNLHDTDLQDMVDQMKAEEAGEGDVIIQQGDVGDKFYIMEEGEVDILIGENKVGSYKGGQAFGDLALIYNTPRAATILATADCTLWTLERAFFAKAKVTSNSNEASGLAKFLSKLKLFPSPVPFFASEGPEALAHLCSALTIKEYKEGGNYIIEQGAVGEDLYILYKGTVQVTETKEDGTEIPGITLGKYTEHRRTDPNTGHEKRYPEWQGVIFGERALIKKERRARNIVPIRSEMKILDDKGKPVLDDQGIELPPRLITDQVTVLSLNKSDFQSLLSHKIREMTDMNYFRILQAVDILKPLKPKYLHRLQAQLDMTLCYMGKRVETNAVDIFIILDGVFETPEGRQLKSGDVVGDLRYAATEFAITISCRTDEESKPCLAQISRQAVQDLLTAQAGDLFDESAPGEEGQSVYESEEERAQKDLRETQSRREQCVASRLAHSHSFLRSAALTDLEVTQELGVGSFGSVFLGRHKPSSRLLAIKCLDKAAISKSNQEFCVDREARALNCIASHPFIADYYGLLVCPRKVVFMLEFVPGGELWDYIYSDEGATGEYGGLPLVEATRYLACVALALEHIHSLGYCYRDLKPENLLFAGNGYLKLVDFGLVKEVPFVAPGGEIKYRTFTTCGTPEYMAPEVILTSGYDRSADLWALGVLFYEMLCRATPFDSGGNNKATFEKICRPTLQLNYPPHFQSHAKVFIRKLLLPNAALRLGNLQNGFKDIYDDYVFASNGVQFDALLRQETPMAHVPAPFKVAAVGAGADAASRELFDCVAESVAAPDDPHVDLFSNLLSM